MAEKLYMVLSPATSQASSPPPLLLLSLFLSHWLTVPQIHQEDTLPRSFALAVLLAYKLFP